jgi:carboxypeptidase Taq
MSTPILIPDTVISRSDRELRNMLQWWHRLSTPTERLAMQDATEELRERLAGIWDLERARLVLNWDQDTKMPPRGAAARAQQIATLADITHERLVAPRTGELIAAAEQEVAALPAESVTARMVAKARWLYDKDLRVPATLVRERAQAASDGYRVWLTARAADDFSAFAPVLERNFALAREYAACFDEYADPYDVVLDDYMPGMTDATISALFEELRGELVPLVDALAGRPVDTSPLTAAFSVQAQRGLVNEVLGWLGFDAAGWRLDDTAHPFQSSFSAGDVRLTTRFEPDCFPTALYGAMHECGHGLYEAGISPELERTPLGRIYSLAVHESQSRMWENMVGRSRAFCDALAPVLAARSGGALRELDGAALFRAVNAVRPSLIRIEADETTYSLHVILRHELERSLMRGELTVADLPEAWNSRMRDYLGVVVPSDAVGVMQDVHWGQGLIGYFPSYAVGNLIGGQIWERVRAALPGLDEQLRRHDLRALREWLTEQIYRHGSAFSDAELLERVAGAPLQVAPFVGYLRGRLGEVYGIELA